MPLNVCSLSESNLMKKLNNLQTALKYLLFDKRLNER